MKRQLVKVEELKRDQVLLVLVRKVHNTAEKGVTAGDLDYKVQIECAEFIDNPWRPQTATSFFNQGDTRFVGQRPRRGFLTMMPQMWDLCFGKELGISSADIAKLEFSSTTMGDVQNPSERKENVHFIFIGTVNPRIANAPKGFQPELHVKIVESTIQVNKNQPAKLNPSTKEEQTKDKLPIYQFATITFGKEPSHFELSDQMKAAIGAGSLQVPAETLKEVVAYNKLLDDTSKIEVSPAKTEVTETVSLAD